MRLSSREIDVPVTINVQLIDPSGTPLTTSALSMSGSAYTVTSAVSSFGRDHSGNYSCTAAVISSNNNSFLMNSNTSSDVTRVAVGKTMC